MKCADFPEMFSLAIQVKLKLRVFVKIPEWGHYFILQLALLFSQTVPSDDRCVQSLHFAVIWGLRLQYMFCCLLMFKEGAGMLEVSFFGSQRRISSNNRRSFYSMIVQFKRSNGD
jgi:hypothetical protein